MITEIISLCIVSYFFNGCASQKIKNLTIKKKKSEKEMLVTLLIENNNEVVTLGKLKEIIKILEKKNVKNIYTTGEVYQINKAKEKIKGGPVVKLEFVIAANNLEGLEKDLANLNLNLNYHIITIEKLQYIQNKIQ
jgi:hypothetical protein